MPTYSITINDQAAKGFADAGVDPATIITQRANEIGAEYANSAKIAERKKLVQEVEESGDIEATYALVSALRNDTTYHNALVDSLVANAVAHSTLIGTEISKGKAVSYSNVVYICTRTHMAQIDWTPDVAITLFSKIPQVDESTGYQVWKPWDGHNESLYQVGDIVWYPEIDTTLYIATLGNNHWQPDSGTGWAVYTE